jgi:hypothetical protein
VTNEPDMPSTTTRVLSDADLALFALLAGHLDLRGEVALSLEATARQPVPQALLAALLNTEALRAASQSPHARISSAALRFSEQAYTDEALHISASASAPDPSGALSVAVGIYSAEGRLLASGTLLVIPG